MKKQFEEYLIIKGYKQITPSGHPSTVYDYIKRIDNICVWENMNWEQLSNNIQKLLSLYDVGGEKQNYGMISHNAVINAFRRFSEFIMR